MENVKMDIAMLCAYMKLSTEALADKAGIDRNHLAAVRAGRAKMLADDIIGLSDATGIDVRNIATKQ
jgi:transcriptional regulator with XRE-family HTH domain